MDLLGKNEQIVKISSLKRGKIYLTYTYELGSGSRYEMAVS